MIVEILGQQVSELLGLGKGLGTALAAVCKHRYAGRFARLQSKVRSLVKDQLLLPLGR